MTVIAEATFDLLDSDEKVIVRLFAPEPDEGTTWVCRLEIHEPIGRPLNIYGEGSLQALALALQTLSIKLYGSEEWQTGRLGVDGHFLSYLGIPATRHFVDKAPYPF